MARKIQGKTFLIVTREFGAELYIAPAVKGQLQVTDKREEAERFDGMVDAPGKDAPRLRFLAAITGYEQLEWEAA